jgi:hypothetical protein
MISLVMSSVGFQRFRKRFITWQRTALEACKIIIFNEIKFYFTSQKSLLYFTPLT